ncbi:MAG: tol-pal system protein YbgF [Thermodesulfobacteriota bacterium]|nr:MAG: tol-pal system protein YbgF [Thermodesulfobacteriota bacterium]
MRIKVITILLLAGISSMSIGCVATQSDVSSVYARQTRLEAKMERLSQQVQSLQGTEVSGGNNIQLQEQVAQLEKEVKDLNRSYATLDAKVNQSSVAMPPPSGTTSIGSEGGSGLPPLDLETEDFIFNQGYTDLSEGNYSGSREQFKLFLSKYPNSSKASDATYWIAESYYRQGEFEEAILEYQKFIDTYPKDDRVPLSYLKQGLSLIEIGREEEAKLFFQTLIDKYPQSEEASTAKEKIRELAVNG